jgi:hypothetical protein
VLDPGFTAEEGTPMIAALRFRTLVLSACSLALILASATPALSQTISPVCQTMKTVQTPPLPNLYSLKGIGTMTGLTPNGLFVVDVQFYKSVTGGNPQSIGNAMQISGGADANGNGSIDTGWQSIAVGTITSGNVVYVQMRVTQQKGTSGWVKSPNVTVP